MAIASCKYHGHDVLRVTNHAPSSSPGRTKCQLKAVGVFAERVLPKPWRMLAPVEGLTGILMSGLSAGLFFAVVSRIFASRLQEERFHDK